MTPTTSFSEAIKRIQYLVVSLESVKFAHDAAQADPQDSQWKQTLIDAVTTLEDAQDRITELEEWYEFDETGNRIPLWLDDTNVQGRFDATQFDSTKGVLIPLMAAACIVLFTLLIWSLKS